MQQEILIVLHTVFAQNELNDIKRKESKKFIRTEKTGEACVNGLLQKLLPVVFKNEADSKVNLWQINYGFTFLQYELGELPLTIEKHYSLNPQYFLNTCCLN